MMTQLLGLFAGLLTASPRRWRGGLLVFGIVVLWLTLPVNPQERFSQRWQTYQATVQASWEHPWVGQGALGLEAPIMLHTHQAPLTLEMNITDRLLVHDPSSF